MTDVLASLVSTSTHGHCLLQNRRLKSRKTNPVLFYANTTGLSSLACANAFYWCSEIWMQMDATVSDCFHTLEACCGYFWTLLAMDFETIVVLLTGGARVSSLAS